MNIKTTLILVLLLAVVGLTFYLMQQRDPGVPDPERETRSAGEPVFTGDAAFTAEQVRRITLEQEGQTIELARRNGDWYQVAPVLVKLNNRAGPQNIAEAAAELSYINRFEPGAGDKPTLEDVRLDPPALTATLTIEKPAEEEDGEPTSAEHTIKLSSRPVGGSGYALIDDRPRVYVVLDGLHNAALAQKPKQWRARSLDAPTAAQADRVQLAHGNTDVTLHKLDGDWFIGDEGTQRADQAAVTGLLDAVKAIYVKEFAADAPESLAPFGLDDPQATLHVHRPGLEDKPAVQHSLTIGGAADLAETASYAMWVTQRGDEPAVGRGVVFSVNNNSLKALRPTTDDLRDPTITPVERFDITGLRIERETGQTIHLLRDGSTYRFADNDSGDTPPFEPDRQAANALLDAILNTNAAGYLPGYTPQTPRLATIDLTTRTGDGGESIAVYDGPDDEHVVTLRSGETVGYRIKRSDLEPVFAPLLSLRDRSVAQVDLSTVRRITVERPDGTFTFDRAQDPADDDAWTLNGEPAYDGPAFETLRNELINLRAERWLAEPVSIDGGITLTVQREQQEPLVLRVNPARGEATRTGEERAFVLPDRVLEALEAEFRPRTVLKVDAAAIESVTIAEADDTQQVTRDSTGRYVDGAGEALNQSAAAGLFDTLAGLEAERFRAPDTVKLDLAQPQRTLTIATADATHTLALWQASQNDFNVPMGRLDEGLPFDLPPEDGEKLLADMQTQAAPPTPGN
jgi:hypothetical protein